MLPLCSSGWSVFLSRHVKTGHNSIEQNFFGGFTTIQVPKGWEVEDNGNNGQCCKSEVDCYLVTAS